MTEGLAGGEGRRRLLLGTAACLLVALSACGGAQDNAAAPETANAEPPLWEQPGLEGAVRPEMGAPQPGDPAPGFELPATGGGAFTLEEARGGWVVLHFTATWCPFCDAEVEHLGAFADDYRDRGVRVLLVDVQEEPEVWAAYVAEHVHSEALITLEDRDGAVAASYAPENFQPSFEDRAQVMLAATVLIDPEGRIRLTLLADSAHFDATLAPVRRELDRMMGSAATAPAATTSAEPAALAPEDVVMVTVDPVPALLPGASGELTVHLDIAEGYHVMSDQPSRPNYIATEVRLTALAPVEWGEVRYPPPTHFRLVDATIRTFEGRTSVGVMFSLVEDALPNTYEVSGEVRYQACTHGSCLFPTTRPFTTSLTVVGPG
ncbi:MAG: redoxin domain-containing protein [Deltaproteobacteria bacterium]|nr:redoxin domain-containing protein [Deltaproteobacteria bacterium]